ncbi:hypothetical protein GCM10011515_03380 [Tsuneonella deserti]|jgi:hypothetical protein|uniref:Secreted protein n=1 Tax=Tsuneonella deserti TaxID=2035528 RepID=A0ABQ1S2G0_9SPHN|nr:hypothetical protein [Tsuneonella deserti]GGD87202.1 hypothetical protein GCM10011515_03380 [Tsuneonella deserti]
MATIIAAVSAGIALLAAGGAWGAVLVNRRNATDTIRAMVNTGARTSRAAVVSANRQKWIDAIRDDVAEFISVRSQLKGLENLHRDLGAASDHLPAEERLLRTRLLMLRARVEMRLNHDEDEHFALLSAMDRYDEKASQVADLALRTKARSIFKAEWTRLKKEASGIDPFVREVVPERR